MGSSEERPASRDADGSDPCSQEEISTTIPDDSLNPQSEGSTDGGKEDPLENESGMVESSTPNGSSVDEGTSGSSDPEAVDDEREATMTSGADNSDKAHQGDLSGGGVVKEALEESNVLEGSAAAGDSASIEDPTPVTDHETVVELAAEPDVAAESEEAPKAETLDEGVVGPGAIIGAKRGTIIEHTGGAAAVDEPTAVDESLTEEVKEILGDKPPSQKTDDSAKSLPPAPEPYQDSASTIRLQKMEDNSASRKQWILKKKKDNLDVEAIDELMLKYGLESVKSHFLWVYDEVQAAKERGDDPKKTTNLDVCFVGESQTGKTMIAELYIKLLESLDLVVKDTLARTSAFSYLYQAWNNATRYERRGILYINDPGYYTLPSTLVDLYEESTTTNPPVVILELPGSVQDNENKIPKPDGKVPAMRTILLQYTGDEMLSMFLAELKKECGKKDVEGGWDGLLIKRFLTRVKDKVTSRSSAFEFLDELKSRRSKRVEAEERNQAPKSPEHIYFTKSDMLGLSAEELGYQSKAWAELQQMIGMEKVKESVRELLGQVALNQRLEMEGKPPINTCFNRRCFIGPPGTGKTTAANLYGRILSDLGLLENSDNIVEKRASDLIGCYVGWSEEATKKAIDSAGGGVLIIDDFHLLLPETMYNTGHTDVFRAAVIDTIVANINPNSKRKEAVILIGYHESMTEAFEKANPGLARRFPLDQSFRFEPYNGPELTEILLLKLRKRTIDASDAAIEVAKGMLNIARHRPNFGNGGDVENLLNKAQASRNARCAKMDVDEDIDMALQEGDFDADWNRGRDADKRCADHFKDMQGMKDIIEQFQRYQGMAMRLQERGHDPRQYIPWALVFRGPPGTGKTTVARKIGKIYYDMGFLAVPEIIECSVADLISSYVGGSGKKVIRMFERALGKVLFIDEAYRLSENNAVDAIGEMVDCMTKERFFGNLVVVLAGYGEDMENLMRWNRGLRSRFGTYVDFKPMRAPDALALLQTHLKKVDIELGGIDPGSGSWSRDTVLSTLSKLALAKSWANGRDVVSFSRIVTEQVYTDKERHEEVPLSVGVDEELETGKGVGKKKRKKILFHADDLIPLLNIRLNKARMEDQEMGINAQRKGHRDRDNKGSLGRAPKESSKADSDDSESEEKLTKSLAEARNADEVELHGYFSLTDFLDEDLMKRVLFNLSRYRPLDEKDEKRLEKNIKQAMKLGDMSWGGNDSAIAGALCLEAMLCCSRYFFGNNQGGNDARQHMEQAEQLARRAVNVTPPDSTDGSEARNLLSEILYYSYMGGQYPEGAEARHLIEAVEATREARDASASLLLGVSKRDINARLGELLKKKYEKSRKAEDLDEAIESMKLSLEISLTDEEDLPDRLQLIIDLYYDKIFRVRKQQVTDDEISDGVNYVMRWLELVDDDSSERVRNLTIAGRFTVWRFMKSGDNNLDEINRAIDLQREGISLAKSDTNFRRELLGDCASTLVTRFRAVGSIQDLDEAAKLAIEGRDMAGTPAEQWKCTLALIRARDAKYEMTLDEAELEASLKEAEAMLEAEDLDREAEASMLEDLCEIHTNRYRMNSNQEDIEKAIAYGERAVEMYPNELTIASHLGKARILRWERTQNTTDFRKAIVGVSEASMAAGGIWNKDIAHMTKASLLRMYRREKKAVHLDNAVLAARMAATKTPKQHGQYEMLASDLAECLLVRYDSNPKKFSSDVDEAIHVSEESIQHRTTNAYYRSVSLQSLGLLFQRKYSASDPPDQTALHKAINYYKQGWAYGNADTAARITCGRAAANLFGLLGQWRNAADVLTACVRMLPRVTGLASGDANQQHVMARYGGLAAACVEALMNAADTKGVEEGDAPNAKEVREDDSPNEEIEAPYGAVAALRHLELGRSVISRLSLEQNLEVDLLRQHDHTLADEYIEARTKLYTFADTLRDQNEDSSAISPMLAGKYKRQVQIEDEYEAVCQRIRDQEGFRNFLRPPPIAEMRAAAGEGMIVVINVGKQRSDAFMITKDGVVEKRLDGVDEETVARERGQEMPQMLDWIWRTVALPILETLPAANNPRWPRVWWVLTGPLTGVPIHAAGLCNREEGRVSSAESVLDRVMSSYATSVMALLYGRRIVKSQLPKPTTSNSYEALLVSMSATPGKEYPDLPNADDEVRAVEAQLRARRLPFKPVTLTDKTQSACLAALRRTSIFHFAGHGRVDKRVPSRSALLLLDHKTTPLTMEAVRDARGTAPEDENDEDTPRFLAYLSACSTGAVGNPDLVDEAIHLVAGMQLARFRHVVGTLWEVSDWYCVQMAVKFYKFLPEAGHIGDDDVCRALHEAIREVRDGRFEQSLFPSDERVVTDGLRDFPHEEGRRLEVEVVATGNHAGESQATLAESGPSRFGVGVRPSGFVAPTQSFLRCNMGDIQRWAPYVHYGV